MGLLFFLYLMIWTYWGTTIVKLAIGLFKQSSCIMTAILAFPLRLYLLDVNETQATCLVYLNKKPTTGEEQHVAAISISSAAAYKKGHENAPVTA